MSLRVKACPHALKNLDYGTVRRSYRDAVVVGIMRVRSCLHGVALCFGACLALKRARVVIGVLAWSDALCGRYCLHVWCNAGHGFS